MSAGICRQNSQGGSPFPSPPDQQCVSWDTFWKEEEGRYVGIDEQYDDFSKRYISLEDEIGGNDNCFTRDNEQFQKFLEPYLDSFDWEKHPPRLMLSNRGQILTMKTTVENDVKKSLIYTIDLSCRNTPNESAICHKMQIVQEPLNSFDKARVIQEITCRFPEVAAPSLEDLNAPESTLGTYAKPILCGSLALYCAYKVFKAVQKWYRQGGSTSFHKMQELVYWHFHRKNRVDQTVRTSP